jgi:hypothetical protein
MYAMTGGTAAIHITTRRNTAEGAGRLSDNLANAALGRNRRRRSCADVMLPVVMTRTAEPKVPA